MAPTLSQRLHSFYSIIFPLAPPPFDCGVIWSSFAQGWPPLLQFFFRLHFLAGLHLCLVFKFVYRLFLVSSAFFFSVFEFFWPLYGLPGFFQVLAFYRGACIFPCFCFFCFSIPTLSVSGCFSLVIFEFLLSFLFGTFLLLIRIFFVPHVVGPVFGRGPLPTLCHFFQAFSRVCLWSWPLFCIYRCVQVRLFPQCVILLGRVFPL